MSPERDEFIAKLEQNLIREKDVREGGKDMPIVEMMPKSGDNYHIHVIVSRRDVRQQYKLSPLSKPTYNKEHIVGNRKCTIGFDRNRFANKIESVFDAKTGYERLNIERFEVLKEMKKEREKGNELTPFDLSQANDHSAESECKDIESSLRETLPHCNSLPELQELPEEKGIVSVMEKDAENKNGIEFHIDGSNKDELIFQQEQVLEDNHLFTPESKHFDLPQANDHDAQCKYIESSLRETLPRCNSMQELQELLMQRGVVSGEDRNLDNEKDIYFYVDGCNRSKHTFSLKDISPNLSYYGIENHVKKEWRKSFFAPRITDKEANPISLSTHFNEVVGKDKNKQSEYIDKTLRDVMPYCDSLKELQERLRIRDIKCDITYIKGKGKIVSFKITSLWNSKTFTSEEISPNLNYRELARHYKEGYSRQNQRNSYTHTYGDSYKAQVATRYVMNRLALESGLKYINKDIKPYRNSVALGVSGIRILVSDKTAREKTVAVAKRVANHFGYKLGFSVAPELMGAVSIVSGIKSLTKILGSDNGQEK